MKKETKHLLFEVQACHNNPIRQQVCFYLMIFPIRGRSKTNTIKWLFVKQDLLREVTQKDVLYPLSPLLVGSVKGGSLCSLRAHSHREIC